MRKFVVQVPGVGTIPNQWGHDETSALRALYAEVQCKSRGLRGSWYDVTDSDGVVMSVRIVEVDERAMRYTR